MQPDPDACGRIRKRKRRGHRHRDSTEAAPPLSPSVILFYYHRDSLDYSCSAYALNTAAVLEDNGDDTKPLPQPLFRFHRTKFPILPGFAALGSKIYIFGGMNSARACKANPTLGLERHALETYVFDTTKPLPSAVDDPKTFLVKGPCLNAPKFHPISVVFKGKIYVFPRSFSRHDMLTSRRKPTEFSPKCEVLDPHYGSWTALPDPPLDPHEQDEFLNDNSYDVVAYAVYDCTFFAYTAKGIYSLNLEHPGVWNHCPQLARFPFTGEAISSDQKHYVAIHPSPKDLLVKHDFTSEEGLGLGLVKEVDSLDLKQPGNQRINCCVVYNMVSLSDDRLLVIRNGLDNPPRPYSRDEFSNFITCNIIQVKNKKNKKQNQSGMVQLASSTFIMVDNPGTSGRPIACFPMMDEAQIQS